MPKPHLDTKTCGTCGRSFEWRKKWADNWDEVRYCSAACRRHRPGRIDRELEEAIVELLESRSPSASICPSEAARAVGGPEWQPLMERSRQAARRLANSGRVEITQGGRAVDPSSFRGPVRIRRRSSSRSE